MDDFVSESARETYHKGQTEMFKDERFVQFILYQVFCEKLRIDDPKKENRVVLEFPAKLLQPFKRVGTPGKPRALDFAISHTADPLLLDAVIPMAIEMKLAANCYTAAKMAAIQSDLIRLSFLRQREDLQGPYARKCYFIMFGLKEELNGMNVPGFSQAHQRKLTDKVESLSIMQLCDKDMVEKVFLNPKRIGKLTGYDIIDEIRVQDLADSTIGPLAAARGEDPRRFKTDVKAWIVHKPDPSNGFLTGLS